MDEPLNLPLTTGGDSFRTIIEAVPQFIWRCTADGAADYVTERFLHFVGKSREEMMGWGWLGLIHAQDRDRVAAEWSRCREEKIPVSVEFRIWVHGTFRWILSEGNPHFGPTGEVTRYYGTWTDIQDRLASRRAIDNERANFQMLFRESPEMVCILRGPDHVFEFVNEAHIKALGFDATGLSVRKAQPESVEVYDLLDEVYRTGKTAELVEIPITLGTRVRFFNLTYAARRGQDGMIDGIMVLGVEVTDQIENRRQIESLASHLREAVDARDDFLSIASHELKTPLTSLQLQAQGHRRLMQRNDPRAFEPVQLEKLILQTERQVARLTRLVDDMLDVSRIRSGKLTIERELFDLGELAEELLERLKNQFLAAGYEPPSFTHAGDLRGFWDRMRLEQVLNNLLTNAMRYGKGRPVEVSVEGSETMILLRVRDRGIGISEGARQKIFDRFERAVNAAEVSGLGLGLFICRQIVTAHGGRIWVESVSDLGSTFFVEMPRA